MSVDTHVMLSTIRQETSTPLARGIHDLLGTGLLGCGQAATRPRLYTPDCLCPPVHLPMARLPRQWHSLSSVYCRSNLQGAKPWAGTQ